MKIAVWFSCGAASAVALEETLLQYPGAEIRAINNPVLEEHPDNRRFLQEVGEHLRLSIELAVSEAYPEASADAVWRKRRYMSGVRGAICTTELKKNARYAWERRNSVDYHVLGFTADEKKRHERFILSERENVLPVLIDAGLTKQDCFERVLGWGIKLPEIYSYGYPNANCIGCVKSSSPGYWNLVRRTFPAVFAERAKLSRDLGVRLLETRKGGKRRRYFLDELSPDWDGPIDSPECGSFCEEK